MAGQFCSSEKQPDLHALTALRGLAAVFVMAYHFGLGNDVLGLFAQAINHGYLCVDLFFTLSGFVMAMTYHSLFCEGINFRNTRLFLGRRFARIYPVYILVVMIFIMMALKKGTFGSSEFPLSVAAISENLLLIQAWGLSPSLDGPTWSISTEMFAYLLFPLLSYMTIYKSRMSAIITAILCAGLLLFLCMVPQGVMNIVRYKGPLDIADYSNPGPLVRCLAEFTLGMLTWRFAQVSNVQTIAKFSWPSLLSLFVILCLLFITNSDFLIVLMFPILITTLSNNKSSTARFLNTRIPRWLGDISYSIYLTHFLLLYWPRDAIQTLLHALHVSHLWILTQFIMVTFTLMLATFLFHMVEMPARVYLRRLFERDPAPIRGL